MTGIASKSYIPPLLSVILDGFKKYNSIKHQLLECHHWVVDFQSELKIVLWKQGVYFLELSKITDRRGRI